MSHDDEEDLLSLRAPPHGRRSNDAFVRAVASDVLAVRRRRSLGWLLAPALAGAVVVTLLTSSGDDSASISGQTWQALADDDVIVDVDVDVDDLDEPTLLALGGSIPGAEPLFALPGLDGSTDRELQDVEAALDGALSL